MRKLLLVSLPFIAITLFCSAFVSMRYHSKNSSGLAGQTGSPGEGTCSGCHFNGSNATTVSINATPSFSNNEFVQGETYTITVTVEGSAYSFFGFGCEILEVPSNLNAGLMQNPGGGVKLVNAGNGRRNAVHTTAKSGTGTANFSFEWVAPNNSTDVRIYAVGNCVNGNGSNSGDFARATSLTLTTPTVTGLNNQKGKTLIGFNLYPNPAEEKINLSYALSDTKQIKIQLISIEGSIVTQLVDEEQINGLHQMNIDIPSDLTSGVYFLKVLANNENVAQRLVMIK